MKSIDGDIENTVFSYIPNTAESAFFGLVEGLDAHCAETRVQKIMVGRDTLTEERLHEILHYKPRVEKIAIKDVKMRTFITQDDERDDLVAHVYDVTYGTIRPDADNLVILDDSIVRGTTLRRSIIRILDRLRPKKIGRLLVGASDPLSGLLRHRHVAVGRLRRIPRSDRTAQGARHA